MRQKITHTNVYSKVNTSMDPGQLESILEDLREKSDIEIADLKEMHEATYSDKVCWGGIDEVLDTVIRCAGVG